MNSEQFCHWLKGWMDLANPAFISPEQTQLIKQNLEKVFSTDATANGFCHMLNGFLSISQTPQINEAQLQTIKLFLFKQVGQVTPAATPETPPKRPQMLC